MKILLIDAKYKGNVELTKEAINALRKSKTIAIYTTPQFQSKIKKIIEQLKKEKVKIISSRPERTSSEFQILGCDIYSGNLNLKEKVDAFLYVGDGDFHPRTFLFQGGDEKVFSYNPISKKLKSFEKKDFEKILKKEKANLKKFLLANKIGILITTKPGQEHFSYVKKLEGKFPDKNFYVFVSDAIDFSEMENFPFIEAWVNSACPRIGKEDILNLEKPLINVEEVLGI